MLCLCLLNIYNVSKLFKVICLAFLIFDLVLGSVLAVLATIRVSKTCRHHQHAKGRFWNAGEHFGQNLTLFCCIYNFVANYALLTVHMNQQARLYCCLETQDCNA